MATAVVPEDDLSCITCHAPFDQTEHVPKLMPCLHTMCKLCLVKGTNGGQHVFMCPICRHEVQHIDDLPNNFVKENQKKYQDLCDEEGVLCGIQECHNDGIEAASFCFSCDKFLCGRCTSKHQQMKDLSDHRVECLDALRDVGSNPFIQYQQCCQKHPQKASTFYCTKDKLTTCDLCRHSNLFARCCVDLAAHKEKIVNNLLQSRDKIGEKLQVLNEQQRKCETFLTELSDKHEGKKREMKKIKNELFKDIEMRYSESEKSYAEEVVNEKKHLTEKLADIERRVAQMIDVTDVVDKACSNELIHPAQLVVLEEDGLMNIQLVKLRKETPPEIPNAIKTNFKFTCEHDAAVQDIERAIPKLFDDGSASPDQPKSRTVHTGLYCFVAGIAVGIGVVLSVLYMYKVKRK